MSSGTLPAFRAIIRSLKILTAGKGSVCDRSLQQQSVFVVDQEFKTLHLVPFNSAFPPDKGCAGVDLGFEDELASIIAALRRD